MAQRRETVILRLRPHADPRPVLAALTGVDEVEVREVTVKEIDGVTQIHAYVVGAHGVDVDRALAGLTEREDVEGLDIA